ncbi:DUF3617 family protein [Sphingomonas sp. HITSZ_GF]|uniref:DUF3617 domain-containing protein n=1 Tax=Sphingomonas sp. HITSZ_GF TaxID=3037247 RepID=UPI00240DEB3F|nr:DUF3617 family protein [Sphingomonas sp. HITSZ_GF]MDG2533243.1 DUF3617 family protein [Sphingomonas sp. HITSZ_GF]
MANYRSFFPLLPAALLAACGGGADKAEKPGNVAGAGAESTAPAASSGYAGQLTPGLYKIQQTGAMTKDDTVCLKAEDIATGKVIVMSESFPEDWTATTDRMADGGIQLDATGPNDGHIEMRGTYTAKSFEAAWKMKYSVNGASNTVDSTVKGEFVSEDCGEG